MRGWDKFDANYFLKYKEKPVKLKPYDPQQEEVALRYLDKIGSLMEGIDIKLLVRGSTAFRIFGKGDVEVGVYPLEKDWKKVAGILAKAYGDPDNVEPDYMRFNHESSEGYEVEIILLKGHEAKVDVKLTEYLMDHPELLKEYEEVKRKSAFSKREYQIRKNDFLTSVIHKIPEEE